jgi:hypothetical protein
MKPGSRLPSRVLAFALALVAGACMPEDGPYGGPGTGGHSGREVEEAAPRVPPVGTSDPADPAAAGPAWPARAGLRDAGTAGIGAQLE